MEDHLKTALTGTLQFWDGTGWFEHICTLSDSQLHVSSEQHCSEVSVDLARVRYIGTFSGMEDERIFGLQVDDSCRHAFCAQDTSVAALWISALRAKTSAAAATEAKISVSNAPEGGAPDGEEAGFKNWAEELLVNRYLGATTELDTETAAALEDARERAEPAAAAPPPEEEAEDESNDESDDEGQQGCVACAGALDDTAVSCGACQAAYCGLACQKKDLPSHLPRCRDLARSSACARWVERFAANPLESAAFTNARLSRAERRATYRAAERLGLRHETEVTEAGKVIRLMKSSGQTAGPDGSQANESVAGDEAEEGWRYEASSGLWHDAASGLRWHSATRSYWRWDVVERGYRPIADGALDAADALDAAQQGAPAAHASGPASHAASFQANRRHPLVQKVLAQSERQEFNALKRRMISRPSRSRGTADQPALRDRAAERRAEHGDEEPPLPLGGVLVEAGALPTDATNVGCKLLKSMGWTEGAGLGLRGDGIREPVAVRGQVGQLGLGSRAPSVYDRYASGSADFNVGGSGRRPCESG